MLAWVVAEFHDAVAPGARAEEVPNVRDRGAELVFLPSCGQVVAEGATRPALALPEEGLYFGDEVLELLVEGVDGWALGAWGGGDDSGVAGDELGEDSGALLRVYDLGFAGCVIDEVLYVGVLAVAMGRSAGDFVYRW